MDIGYKLKTIITEIVKKYMDNISFSGVCTAKLVSISPLKFVTNDGIEIYNNFLVVPKYRKFTIYEIGNEFVFISNYGGQVFYYLYEASFPRGSNGVEFHIKGKIKKGEIIGKISQAKKEVTITEVVEDKEIINKKIMNVDIFTILEGDFDNVMCEEGIIKKE